MKAAKMRRGTKNGAKKALCFLFYADGKLASFIPSYSVDVALKVTVLEQSCNNVLLKGRYGAGVKTKMFVKIIYKPLRQYHIADTQGRRYGF